jgi:alpha-ketoglutarate-dependent taurine dioxygenase
VTAPIGAPPVDRAGPSGGREAGYSGAEDLSVTDGTVRMLTEDIRDRRAWRRESLAPRDWLVTLPPACLDELDAAVHQVRRDPLPTLLLTPDQFSLAACAEAMGQVRRRLREIGLAVAGRLPVERYEPEENRALCWLLSQLVGRPVAQAWNGAMLYDVRDTGKTLEYGVRRSITNLDLTFHTDGPWLPLPPHVVGLYCINPAVEGGVSRFVSLSTVHNELRRRHPDLLPRLYRPFPWDRQAEHAPGDAKAGAEPIFRYDGRSLVGRFNERLIESGAELAGAPLDAHGKDALEAMRTVVDSPELWVEFTIERGQLQYLDNREFAHSRTDFRDAPEPHRKRHLLRVWTREEGRRTFHP